MANLGKSVKGKNKKKKEEKAEKVMGQKAKRVFDVDVNKQQAALTRRLLRVCELLAPLPLRGPLSL